MKKFLLLVSLLLVVPNVAMGAESTAPKPNAAPSKWLSWFRGVPHLTMDHLAKARAYMYSKWRCVVRGEGCSKRQRNALRALSVAIVGAAGVVADVVGVAVKSRMDRNKRAAAIKAFREAAAAETAALRADAWDAAAEAADAFAARAAADDAADDADAARAAAADAVAAAFRAAANIFPEVETELGDVYTTYAALKAAAKAADNAAWDAWDVAEAAWDAITATAAKAADRAADAIDAADPKRADALQALAAALKDSSTANLTAVADAIKEMDAQ